VRHTAIETLARFPEPRCAEAIAGVFAENKIQANKALMAMGPAAEPAVATLLDHAEWPIRTDACKILGEIGTAKSLPILDRLADEDENSMVRHVAGRAAEAIREREGVAAEGP
jgi:HEAT repeat protein